MTIESEEMGRLLWVGNVSSCFGEPDALLKITGLRVREPKKIWDNFEGNSEYLNT